MRHFAIIAGHTLGQLIFLALVVASGPYGLEVDRVIDGDTIQADVNLGLLVVLEDQRIRLEGVDCPELPSDEGKEAKAFTEQWLTAETGESLTGSKRDSFGRILGVIHGSDGTLNDEIVTAGHGVKSKR